MQQNPSWSGAEYNAGPLCKLTVEPISSIYIKIICIPKTQPLYHLYFLSPNPSKPLYQDHLYSLSSNPSKPFPVLSIPVLYHRLLLTSNIGFCAQQSITGADSQQWHNLGRFRWKYCPPTKVPKSWEAQMKILSSKKSPPTPPTMRGSDENFVPLHKSPNHGVRRDNWLPWHDPDQIFRF